MSKTIYESDYSRELRQFGLEHLTGESCAISLRILYDMSTEGITLIEDAFSIKIDRQHTPKNWNSLVNGNPAIASVRLSRGQVKDLLIYGLAQRYKWVTVVTAKPIDNRQSISSWIYVTNNIDDQRETVDIISKSDWYSGYRVYTTFDSQPRQGLENVHAWSNRAR